MEVKVKEIVKYKGHTVKQNGSVDLKLTAMYSELTKSMQVLQMLNHQLKANHSICYQNLHISSKAQKQSLL